MRRRSLIVFVVVLALAALLWMLTRRGSSGVEVDVASVERRAEFRSFVTASGEIVADRFADIGSSVMGRVVELRVKEGEQVKAGQVLARLDPVQARSQSEAAQAQVTALAAERDGTRQQLAAARADLAAATARAAEARANRQRVEKLFAEQLVSAGERDAAVAASDAADAQVAAAEAAVPRASDAVRGAERRITQARALAAGAGDLLAQTQITAPIDGLVSRLQVREGEMVVIGIQNQPGTTLMTISDLSEVNAEIKVAEADVLRLALDQTAEVTLEALPGRRFPGRVIEIGTSALPTTGTGGAATAAAREFRVVVRIAATDIGLRPGLTCDAEVLTDVRKGALVAPLQAVVLRPDPSGGADRAGVFVVRDGRAAFVPVTTGIIGGLDIEVDGVDEGTTIVSGPFQVLRTLEDGAAVTVR
jgi:HlyD family secretion protein